MPLWRVATAPDDLDASADALAETTSEGSAHLSPTKSTSTSTKDSSPEKNAFSAPFLMQAEQPVDLNKNTNWFSYPGIWSMYFIIVLLVWLLAQAVLGCSTATAWIIVHVTHFFVTFYLFHWKKGSPFTAEDQGTYEKLTWWEQMDSGLQLTKNRKFLTLVPVFLFIIVSVATKDVEHASALLFVNTAIVFTLVIAKLPVLHKIRILGINS